MKTRPLVIDDSIRRQIATVKEYAKANILESDRLKKLSAIKDPRLAIGLNPLTGVQIPFGYRVIYSLERQPVQGLCHHISISVDEEETPEPPAKVLPSQAAVEVILSEFGMNPLDKCLFIWVEEIDDGGGGAINVLDVVKEAK